MLDYFCFVCFETGSHVVAHTGTKFAVQPGSLEWILQSPPSRCWDYNQASWISRDMAYHAWFYAMRRIELRALYILGKPSTN